MLTCCEEPRVTNPTKGGDELGIVNLTEALGEKATPPQKNPTIDKGETINECGYYFLFVSFTPLRLSNETVRKSSNKQGFRQPACPHLRGSHFYL